MHRPSTIRWHLPSRPQLRMSHAQQGKPGARQQTGTKMATVPLVLRTPALPGPTTSLEVPSQIGADQSRTWAGVPLEQRDRSQPAQRVQPAWPSSLVTVGYCPWVPVTPQMYLRLYQPNHVRRQPIHHQQAVMVGQLPAQLATMVMETTLTQMRSLPLPPRNDFPHLPACQSPLLARKSFRSCST